VKPEAIAAKVFGMPDLRPGQAAAIAALAEGRDCLVMPSGAGKSAVYQIAAMARGGPAVAVSPLLSLQRDQARSLAEEGDRLTVLFDEVGYKELATSVALGQQLLSRAGESAEPR
jgi:ATP-dependent DNA helicase RecQ